MSDEVRIVAKLDTTDVSNGVKRMDQAQREMKQVWEQSTAVGFPVDQISDKLKSGVPWGQLGQSAGKSFFDGFVGKLLFRDAIYTLISGAAEIFKTITGDLGRASGDKTPQEGFFANYGHSIASEVIYNSDALRGSSSATTAADIARETAARNMDRTVDEARNNPALLQKTSAYENQLESILNQKDENQKEYNTKRQVLADVGQATPAAMQGLQAAFAPQEQHLSMMEQHLKELISLGKERDKKDNDEGRLAMEGRAKSQEREEQALENSRAEQRAQVAKDAAAAAKKEKADEKAAEAAKKKAETEQKHADEIEARRKKNHQQHANEQTIAGDEEGIRSGDKELGFDRTQLENQRATSAVRINGGLFGRNDSAATLVQHAATQIQLLRSINEELKNTRKNQSDLTLL